MKRTPLKRSKRLNPVNRKRRTSEFARCYHSKAYIRHLHAMPCAACGVLDESEAAHGATGGMGYKAGWETLLPLCRVCHAKQHQRGWTSIAMTEESRLRAAKLVQDTFIEAMGNAEG